MNIISHFMVIFLCFFSLRNSCFVRQYSFKLCLIAKRSFADIFRPKQEFGTERNISNLLELCSFVLLINDGFYCLPYCFFNTHKKFSNDFHNLDGFLTDFSPQNVRANFSLLLLIGRN